MDPATKDRFVELRAQGMSFASISEQLGVSKTTLIEWSKDLRETIGNLRQVHLEALREKYCMGEERRLSLLAKQLEIVEKELATRDLLLVPTERLFDMAIKLSHELGKDSGPITLNKRGEQLEYLTQEVAWKV